MNPDTFLPLREAALQAHGEPFTRADVLAFVHDAWPLIAEDLDAERWAREFIAVGWGPAKA